MKLFDSFKGLIQKKPKVEPEVFLSLILDETFIQAGTWILTDGKKAKTIAATSERAVSPTWEDRIKMTDHALGKLAEESGTTRISKVVFGLGEGFLTKEGDIEKTVRPHLKRLSQVLQLSPLGFVPISTSIAHYLRKVEGIPTSVILIGVTELKFDINIYRVGRLAFSVSVKRGDSEGKDIEDGLKQCSDEDVLPSRILLYGGDDVRIHEVKAVLLRYQWTTRANFLHYPKIDVFPFQDMIESVVEAGANELTQGMSSPEETVPSDEEQEQLDVEVETPSTEEKREEEKLEEQKESKETIEEKPIQDIHEPIGDSQMVVVQPEALGFHEGVDEKEQRGMDEDLENIEEVESPLEFAQGTKENLLHKSPTQTPHVQGEGMLEDNDEPPSISKSGVDKHAAVKLPQFFSHIPLKAAIAGIVVLLLAVSGYIISTSVLPTVKVTLSVLPITVSHDDTIKIDPTATQIDAAAKVIPGKKLENIVSGEKKITTTGKKKVGDPGKGSVTIFNKSENSAFTLKKGTVLSTGSLQFALDSDVSIASASTNLSQGQTVFGKATGSVTALAVGAEGNISANKEFTFKEYATSVLVARNDQAFTGGTSREITVVSRADYDNLQKALTEDLIQKAKTELSGSVTGKEKMIDDTVKTAVKEKKFTQEIDQESKELHGTLSVSVSAITYSEDDIATLLSEEAQKKVPAGYSVNQGRTTVNVAGVTVSKNGTMTAKASLSSVAVPSISMESVKQMIAGKKIAEVEKELRAIKGVSSAEFLFSRAWKKDVLPKDGKNISISVVTVE